MKRKIIESDIVKGRFDVVFGDGIIHDIFFKESEIPKYEMYYHTTFEKETEMKNFKSFTEVANEKALKTMNKQIINYHISRDGWISLCGKTRYDSEENGDQIHWHYYPRELDEGTWCPECQAVWAKDPEIQACQS